VDLADGLRVWHGPQMIHYGAFQIPEPRQLDHNSFIS
jgi:hypothetical protein